MLISGPHAEEISPLLRELEMQLTVVGGETGAAAAIKMIRSVMIKGIEALTLECFLAAEPRRRAGGSHRVAEEQLSRRSIGPKSSEYNLERMASHGERRAAEMEESAATLRELGLDPLMVESTVKRQREMGALGKDEKVRAALAPAAPPCSTPSARPRTSAERRAPSLPITFHALLERVGRSRVLVGAVASFGGTPCIVHSHLGHRRDGVAARRRRADSLDGAYRGSYVCEKTQATQNILRVPIDVLVTGKDVRFGRPLFNLRGTRVTGTELASGTVDDGGKLHMASDYVVLGFAVHGDYEGTIGAHGGTFTGTQSWQWPDGRRGSRTCVAALVPAPRATHPAAPQQQ